LLLAASESLDRLADALLQEETVDRETLEQILGPRPEIEVKAVQNPKNQQAVVEVVK
jgi:hypothetical protein